VSYISLASNVVFKTFYAVTESDMAIAMAEVGGMGFLHYNMSVRYSHLFHHNHVTFIFSP